MGSEEYVRIRSTSKLMVCPHCSGGFQLNEIHRPLWFEVYFRFRKWAEARLGWSFA
jgi:hypothetical protein